EDHRAADEGGDGAASIHDIVRVREPGLAARLHYDPFERRSGLVHIVAADTAPETFAAAAASELTDLPEGRFSVLEATRTEVVLKCSTIVRSKGSDAPVVVTKRFRFDGDRRSPAVGLEVTVVNEGETPIGARLGLAWSLNLLGGGGNPAAWWDTAVG